MALAIVAVHTLQLGVVIGVAVAVFTGAGLLLGAIRTDDVRQLSEPDRGSLGMSRTPSISVVMPTYNRVEALRETLPDLLRVRGVFEVIVVDDGSTDGTFATLDEFNDARLRVVRHAAALREPCREEYGCRGRVRGLGHVR